MSQIKIFRLLAPGLERHAAQHPRSLRLFAAITRNPSLDRWRERKAEKRGGELDVLLLELEARLPTAESIEDAVESHELARAMGR